jgi:hypothetical protein
MIESVKRQVFREPARERRYVAVVIVALIGLIYVLAFPPDSVGRMLPLTIGTMVLFFGIAELLPRSQRTLAGILRMVSYLALISVLVVILASTVL